MNNRKTTTRTETVAEGVVSLEEAREMLGGISQTTIYKLMGDGLAWVRVGGSRKIPRVALREYLESNLHSPTAVGG